MKFQGALIQEQGVKFAIVVVKRSVIQSPSQRSAAQRGFGSVFPGVPVVLMAQDSRGAPTYWGRPDLARFVSKVPMQAIPWKEYRAA
jgi:hypothetical protein